MRNRFPSAESQKPSTATRSLASALANHPVTAASVNGFPASGALGLTVTSTKS